MAGLRAARRAAAAKAVADAEAALRLPRPRQRLDAGLAAVLAGLVAAGAAAGFGLYGWLAGSGSFGPPLVGAVEDPRILTDYRDNPAAMVDLVVAGDDLLIGRQDGSIDRFDLAGRTFAAEALPRDGRLGTGLARLAADCGAQDCAGAAVFALTEGGGLAQRQGAGRWQVVLGDMAFAGADGTPVEQEQVRGWAASADGDLVLVDAGAQGLGLFDQRDGSWRTGPAVADATLGPLHAGGAFWLAGPRGVHRVDPEALPGAAAPLPGTGGEILDLAPDPAGGVLAVRRGACAQGGGSGCLAVLQLDPRGRVAMLLAEAEALPDLNDAGLVHVVRQGEDLLALGTAGVHRYDAGARHWRRLAAAAPTAHFAQAGGARLHVALPDRVLSLAGGRVVAEIALDQPLRQILPGDGAALFGLDRAGRVLALEPPRARVLAPADAGAPADAYFTHAVAAGALFVALGPQGVLVHDTRARRYGFTPSAALPPLPLEDALVAAAGPARIWIVARATGEVHSLAIGGEFPDKVLTLEPHGSPGTAVVQARPTPQGIELVAADGRAFRLAARPGAPVASLTGPPLPGPLRPVAMADAGGRLVFTDGTALWGYEAARRGWSGPVPAPAGARLTDIAAAGGRLLAMDGGGRAWALHDGGWQPVSGGPVRAEFGAAAVQDALAEGQRLYLAADSRVQVYLPGARSFGPAWQATGRGAEILSAAGEVPLWTNSGGLYRGETRIFGGAQFVDGWLGAAGPVALGDAGGRLYLAHGAGCLYLGSAAPTGELRDVVALDADRLLVRTRDGAGIYEPALHRWLAVGGLGAGEDSRLLNLAGHLVRLDPGGLASVPIAEIAAAGSCEVAPVAVRWRVQAAGVQAALVDGAPEVLVLERDGTLRRWRDGALSTLAHAPGAAPAPAGLLRAYAGADAFVGLTADALWSYDLTRRIWQRQGLAGVPAGLAQIDAVFGATGPVVSAWDRDGGLWAGRGRPDGGDIGLARIARPELPAIPIPPAGIRDIAAQGGEALMLSDRRLLVYPQGTAQPRLDLALPAPRIAWRLVSDATGALILLDGDPAAPLAVHRLDRRAGGRHDLAAVAASYQPRDDRAHAFERVSGGAVELVRIDRDLNTWRCALPAGRAPDCRLLVGPPMPLSAAEVRGHHAATGTLLTADALWRLDAALRPLARIEGPAVGPDGALFQNGGALLFWEGPGGALWRLQGGRASRVLARVDWLRTLGDRTAALVGDEVIGLAGDAVIPPRLPAALGQETIRRAHYTAAGHVLLTGAGRAVADGGRLLSDPLIAFDPAARAVLPLRERAGMPRWLEVAGEGSLRIRSVGTCLRQPAPPLPPPAGFIGPLLPPVTPEPVAEPCMTVAPLAARLRAGEQVVELEPVRDGRLVIHTNGRELTLAPDGSLAERARDLPGMAQTIRQGLPADAIRNIDGRSWLNPPALEDGLLAGGAEPLRLAPLAAAGLPAWDIGWLAWQRQGRSLRLAAEPAPLVLPVEQAIRDGRFLPLAEARGAMLADGRVAWLNRFGLWHQDGGRMWRVAAAGGLPAVLDQGRFLAAGGGGIAAQDGAAVAGPPARRFALRALEVEVDPAAQRVTATIRVAGSPVPAFADRGFLHDRRLGVTESGRALYLTPVGLVPVQGLDGLDEAPAGATRIEAEAGGILARLPRGWLRRDRAGGTWAAAAAPFGTGLLAQENGRLWERRAGVVELRAARAGEDWRIARQGLEFDTDRLLGFAATPALAVAVTRAGSHAVAEAGALGGVAPPVAAAPAGVALDARRVAPGRHVLFAAGPRGHQVWDAAAQGWRAPQAGERPWEDRLAAEVAGIAVAFRPGPQFAVTVETVDGGARTLPFAWGAAEAMPFDHVTALHADRQEDGVLLGTRLGLRRLVPAGAGFANAALTAPAAGGAGVGGLGRPLASPGRIEVAFAGGACAETPTLAAPLRPCTVPQGLAERFVAETPLWGWSKSAAAVEGRYLLDGGGRLPVPQPLQGYLPHDRLADLLTCAGVTAEAWRDHAVLRLDGRQVALPGLRGLYCQPGPAVLDGGARLDPGLYALTAGGALRFDGRGFAPVAPEAAAAVAERAAGRVVLDADRLRYGLAGGRPQTELLSLARRWGPVEWRDGRLVLDQPQWLAWRGGLQAVTDAGVVAVPGGVLDPARLVAMEGPAPGALADCAAERVEALDGRQHGLAGAPGDPLRLYCRDGTWLQGRADASRDLGSFAPVAAAASRRSLVAGPGLWQVEQSLDAMGRSTAVALAFRGEPARLAAGRFDFDAWRGIAAPFAGQVELLTDSGWWRAPPGLALAATLRPDLPLDPRAVAGLWRDLSPRSGAAGVCLALAGGARRVWSGAGLEAVGQCREAQGRDPIWQWWGGEPGAVATGTGLDGTPLQRRLTAGRFADLVLSAPPMRAANGHLLAPGGAGVLVLDPARRRPVGLYAAEEGGLLVRGAGAGVALLGPAGARLLDGASAPLAAEALACPGLAALAMGLPPGARLLRAQPGAAGMAEVLVGDGAGVRQALVDCADGQARFWASLHDVAGHPRNLALPGPRPDRLLLSLTPGRLTIEGGGHAVQAPAAGPAALRGLTLRPGGEEALAIDAGSLWSLRIAPAIGLLASEGRPPPPPPAPPPPAAAQPPAPPATAASPPPPPPASPPAPAVAPAAPAPAPSVSAASAGDEAGHDVAAVQRALAAALGIRLAADGIAGPRTRAAIRQWQAAAGSEPTGFLSAPQVRALLSAGGP